MEKLKAGCLDHIKIRVHAHSYFFLIMLNVSGALPILLGFFGFFVEKDLWWCALILLSVGLGIEFLFSLGWKSYVELNLNSHILTISYAFRKSKTVLNFDHIYEFRLWTDNGRFAEIEIIGRLFTIHTKYFSCGLLNREYGYGIEHGLRKKRFEKFVRRANELLAAMQLVEK